MTGRRPPDAAAAAGAADTDTDTDAGDTTTDTDTDTDTGAATVWVAALLVLVLTATVLAVAGTTATTSRHAAQLAADLAALAGAGRIGVDDASACAAAARVATANGARLRACAVTATGARTGEVRVEVDRPAGWSGLDLSAHARARAARVAPGPRPPAAHPARDVRPPTTDHGPVRAAGPCGSMIGARARVTVPGLTIARCTPRRRDNPSSWEAHVDLTLNTARVQERAVLEVGGEVDMYSSPTLRERIAELLDSGESVLVVDLSGTSFLDSTGLGALVAGLNHAKQVGGEMPIVCSSDRILKLFRITGLDGVFTIYPSVDDAVAAQPA